MHQTGEIPNQFGLEMQTPDLPPCDGKQETELITAPEHTFADLTRALDDRLV